MLAKEVLPQDVLDRFLISPNQVIELESEGYSEAVGHHRIRMRQPDGGNLGMVWDDNLKPAAYSSLFGSAEKEAD